MIFRQFAALLLALTLGFAPHPAFAVLKGVAAAPGLQNAASVSITGGSIATTSGVSLVLNQGGIPLISLSSGSVAANGAISAITALPAIYPDGYCYFPANALATSIVAGWYYCTFSSTTAGVAFLNTAPATGALTIPASPTAVTDGKGAFTGDTGEEFGLTLNVPILNATSALRISQVIQATNNANVKTVRGRLSGTAGTVFVSTAAASAAESRNVTEILNTGSVSKQTSVAIGGTAGGAVTANIMATVNTGVATTLVLSLQKATATDNIVLIPPLVELFY